MDLFPIDTLEFSDIRTELRNQLSRKNDIDKVLNESYKALIELDTTRALQIVEEALSKYPSSKLLQFRRDDIKKLINSLNAIKRPEEKRKQYPRPSHKGTELGSTTRDVSTGTTIIDLKPTKRKFPKVKRK